jgi:hypothetical protein
VDINGQALTYDGTSWSSPSTIDYAATLGGVTVALSVSCASPSFCVAVDSSGNALTYDGASWSAPSNIDPVQPLWGFNSVSCASPTFCVAVDESGKALTYDGNTWSSSNIGGSDANSVSCASTTFCVATVGEGGVSVYDGHSWTAPTTINLNVLSSISCTPSGFCAAAAGDCQLGGCQGAAALVRVDGSWAAPANFDNNANTALAGVSCVSDAFCVAVDGRGNLFIYHGIAKPYPPNHPSPSCYDSSNPIVGANGKPICADGSAPTCPHGYSVAVTVDAIVYCKPGATLKPINKSGPVIKGKAMTGRKLTVMKGVWAGTAPIVYKYQWVSCNKKAKKCKNIRGATRNTLKLGSKNVGHRLKVVITARNSAGSAKAASKLTSIVKK